MKHTRATHHPKLDCGPYGCNICNLFLCTVCVGAEGSLPTDCPGVRMTQEQEQNVYAGQLDYRDGKGWCTPDGEGDSMGDIDVRMSPGWNR